MRIIADSKFCRHLIKLMNVMLNDKFRAFINNDTLILIFGLAVTIS